MVPQGRLRRGAQQQGATRITLQACGAEGGLAGAVPSAFVQRPRQQVTLLAKLPPRSTVPTPLAGCPLTSTPRLHQTRTQRSPDLPQRASRAGRRTSRVLVWEFSRERVSVESKGCYSVALKVVLRVCQGCQRGAKLKYSFLSSAFAPRPQISRLGRTCVD